MAEFVAMMMGIGVMTALVGLLRYKLKQKQWERRIESAIERYNLNWDK